MVTKSHMLYKAVNKMCISLNSLSVEMSGPHCVFAFVSQKRQPIKMHFAQEVVQVLLSSLLKLDTYIFYSFKSQLCCFDWQI